MPALALPDPGTLLLIVVAFALAGGIKGVVGLGLPTISAGIMASVIDLRAAVGILIVPLLVTNLWQVLQVGGFGTLARRFGVLNLAAGIGLWIGTEILFSVDPRWMRIGLGVLLIANAAFQFSGRIPTIPRSGEARLAVPIGLVSGVVGGTTGSQGIVIAVYLASLNLTRDEYVQGVGLSFFLTGLVWAAAIAANGGITAETLPLSAVALAVALAAMAAGTRLRRHLPQARFRQAVFLAMALIGANLIRRAVLG
ncbi:membrane protein [Thalassobaculum fulvum]|uniref:Probable membrane transporter protein n=1 Tax=Thalassobaculum fulvum TaxID=1633335 RepID=A0A918XUY6_9PROT|nr:sulfite exporter TauE/SafE family protein [Thalassobaculum fulvum]GHD56831.1 membrane protein [Thalassobaculum fulvum]